MTIPLQQQFHVAQYILGKKLAGEKRYPLVLMLEPLFRCNLACAGCGKIDYPNEILDQRLSVEDCISAAEECGAPIVSVAGGEPLLHKEMPKIVSELIKRKRYVYLCTNALLLAKRIKHYQPSPYLTFSIHLDGTRDRHDTSVCQRGVYDRAIDVIKECLAKDFRVTINCTLFQGETAEEIAEFFNSATELGIEGITVSSGFSYEHAPRQDVFLERKTTKELFRSVFRLGKGRGWKFNHSSLYLDFLAGNQSFECTPWGNPTRNVFGWQKPCYLLVDEGYAQSYKALMEETDWDKYGTGRNPKCANCMAHCGYEATAVNAVFSHPFAGMRASIYGPRIQGEMAPELPIQYTAPILVSAQNISSDRLDSH
jgi:hopanoid biosynthesis associated radical SAM protein HpnH